MSKENVFYANSEKIKEYKKIIIALLGLLEGEWRRNGGMPISGESTWRWANEAISRKAIFYVDDKKTGTSEAV